MYFSKGQDMFKEFGIIKTENSICKAGVDCNIYIDGNIIDIYPLKPLKVNESIIIVRNCSMPSNKRIHIHDSPIAYNILEELKIKLHSSNAIGLINHIK